MIISKQNPPSQLYILVDILYLIKVSFLSLYDERHIILPSRPEECFLLLGDDANFLPHSSIHAKGNNRYRESGVESVNRGQCQFFVVVVNTDWLWLIYGYNGKESFSHTTITGNLHPKNNYGKLVFYIDCKGKTPL